MRIEAMIDKLEKLPKEIADAGRWIVRSNISSHDNYDTGRMYNSVQSTVSGNSVTIRVNTFYANWVNSGRGPVYPKNRATWTGKNVKSLHIKGSNKYYEGFAKYVKMYPGSHFFDRAYEDLDRYIDSML